MPRGEWPAFSIVLLHQKLYKPLVEASGGMNG
jgi:hypothetical protein